MINMARYKCETHDTEVSVEGNTRTFKEMSYGEQEQCKLFTMVIYEEGKTGKCIIKKI